MEEKYIFEENKEGLELFYSYKKINGKLEIIQLIEEGVNNDKM